MLKALQKIGPGGGKPNKQASLRLPVSFHKYSFQFPQGILQATFLCLVWPVEVVQNLRVVASNTGCYRNSPKKLNSFQNGMLLWQLLVSFATQ